MLLTEFINGVTVLSETEIKEPTTSSIVIASIIASIIGIVILILIFCVSEELLYFAIIPIALVLSILVMTSAKPTGEYEYKVTIDNTVSMIEFYEKYEIVGQEGKIYTIRFME